MTPPLRRRLITGASAGAILLLALTACGGKAATPSILSSSAAAPSTSAAPAAGTAVDDEFDPPRPSTFPDAEWAGFLSDFPKDNRDVDPNWIWGCSFVQEFRESSPKLTEASDAFVSLSWATADEVTTLFTYMNAYLEPVCVDFPQVDDTFSPVQPDAVTDEQWAMELANLPTGDRVTDPAWQDVCIAFGRTTVSSYWETALETYGQEVAPGTTPDDWRAYLAYLRDYIRPVCQAMPPAEPTDMPEPTESTDSTEGTDPAVWTSVCDSVTTYCVTSDWAEETLPLTAGDYIVIDMPDIQSVDCPGTGQVYSTSNSTGTPDGPVWYTVFTYDEAGVAGENTCTVLSADGSEFSFYVSVSDPA